MRFTRHGIRRGLTLIELLCVIAIIMVLAALVLGPANRVLKRVRADQWADVSSARLQSTVEQLQKHFQGRPNFPLVTLERIEREHLVSSIELDFLKDRRVRFVPFSAFDPDEKIFIRVSLDRGYLTEAGMLTESKGRITKLPE